MAADPKETSAQDTAEAVATDSETLKAAATAAKAERLSPADLIREFEHAQLKKIFPTSTSVTPSDGRAHQRGQQGARSAL